MGEREEKERGREGERGRERGERRREGEREGEREREREGERGEERGRERGGGGGGREAEAGQKLRSADVTASVRPIVGRRLSNLARNPQRKLDEHFRILKAF